MVLPVHQILAKWRFDTTLTPGPTVAKKILPRDSNNVAVKHPQPKLERCINMRGKGRRVGFFRGGALLSIPSQRCAIETILLMIGRGVSCLCPYGECTSLLVNNDMGDNRLNNSNNNSTTNQPTAKPPPYLLKHYSSTFLIPSNLQNHDRYPLHGTT